MARTTLDLDAKLMAKGMEVTGAASKKALVEEAVDELIKAKLRQGLLEMIGNTDLDMTVEELIEWRRRSIPREWLEEVPSEAP